MGARSVSFGLAHIEGVEAERVALQSTGLCHRAGPQKGVDHVVEDVVEASPRLHEPFIGGEVDRGLRSFASRPRGQTGEEDQNAGGEKGCEEG
jgi:hypothetical protein